MIDMTLPRRKCGFHRNHEALTKRDSEPTYTDDLIIAGTQRVTVLASLVITHQMIILLCCCLFKIFFYYIMQYDLLKLHGSETNKKIIVKCYVPDVL